MFLVQSEAAIGSSAAGSLGYEANKASDYADSLLLVAIGRAIHGRLVGIGVALWGQQLTNENDR